VVEGAERKSDGLALLLLATAFAGGLAFPALVAGGGALAALRVDVSSTDVRASATFTSRWRPSFGLATVAGGDVSDPVTAAGGDCEAVRSDGLIV
jgi:hypothetical protein